MCNNCTHLKEFNSFQMDIIKKHLSQHSWFRQIEDKNEAIVSFIHDYAFMLREAYCRFCPDRDNCAIYRDLIK